MRKCFHCLSIVLTMAAGACAGRMPNVNVTVDCPQPAAELVTKAPPLKQVPPLPEGEIDPPAGILILTTPLPADVKAYGDLADRHERLIQHGVDQCKWIR